MADVADVPPTVVTVTSIVAAPIHAGDVAVICVALTTVKLVAAVPPKVLEGIIAQIPVGRLGSGEEIADTVSFLAGERAGYVTGTTLSLNGGQYLVG